MRLIGMLDSPYVRRVAVSMKLMGIPFDHEPISVFRDFEQFAEVNPVVKAPTLFTDDGVVLVDSTLILEYLQRLAPAERRLTPTDLHQHARAQRILGLALAACDKTVQIVYEHNLRPPEIQFQPWLDRVWRQLRAAYRLLEDETERNGAWRFGEKPLLADITAAVTWRFTSHMLKDGVAADEHPRLARLSERAEELPEFLSCPLE